MSKITVAELFAGVGGFRLGLEGYKDKNRPEFNLPSAGPYKTIWANQWEPPGTEAKQFAARCYKEHFGEDPLVNEDINLVLDLFEAGALNIPDVDMVVGGFPCQDYSVARPLSQSGGIEGVKGVLWWDIYRFLRLKSPKYVLLENVDRLLKSPASQRGRDFAIMLSCFASLGYSVEWRVVNSAEYGFPQRRKRIFIYAEKGARWKPEERLMDGVMAKALPFMADSLLLSEIEIPEDPYEATQTFNKGGKNSPFLTAGVMQGGVAVTTSVIENYSGPRACLGDVLVPESDVPEEFYIQSDALGRWKYLKGSKREPRTDKRTGHEYFYSEGAMAFPDLLENPSRTILTGEGGSGPSRFKHIIFRDGKWRRLVPEELERLQGFPAGWTDTGMTDGQRAFCMGNALVVGVVHLIAKEIAKRRDS